MLSSDIFIAFFAYGVRGIRVPRRTLLVTASVCAGVFLLFGSVGFYFTPFLPAGIGKAFGFITLLIIGLIRVFDSAVKALIRRGLPKRRIKGLSALLEVYAAPESADVDAGGELSVREGVLLAAAMSFDGAAAGLGAAAGNISVSLTSALSFLFCVAAIYAGQRLGRYFTDKVPADLSAIGGVLLIVLAFTKLK